MANRINRTNTSAINSATHSTTTYRRTAKSRRRRNATIKRYFIVTIAFILIVCAAFIGGMKYSHVSASNRTSVSNDLSSRKCYTKIEIHKGDTLWGIAEEHMDSHYASTEDYVSEIMQINGLTEDNIKSGDYLMLAYYE